MRKHITRLLTTLLALVMLLPIVAQAAPTDGWTDEAVSYTHLTLPTNREV